MSKEERKNTALQNESRKESMEVKELALEIKEAIEDCFVAQAVQEENKIYLHFPAGKSFALCIEEQNA